MSVEAVLVAIAGFLGGFVSTLASNGSSVTLPALEFFGLADHTANGTNRLSVVALGLVATISFWREGLIDWRAGARIAVIIAVGTLAGSFIAVELSDAGATRSWTPSSSAVCTSSSRYSSCVRAAGSTREMKRSGRSTGGRRRRTSPSVSTRAWSSSARASSCSPRSSCSPAANSGRRTP